jgi:DNA polymerase III epsilon subunit-like protein
MSDKGFIIIDTETTGLFTHKNPDGSTRPSDAPGQPRMAEFAAVIADAELNIESTYQSYILPNNWRHKHPERDEDGELMDEMPPEVFAIHGLAIEFLRQHGKPVEMALSVYDKAVREGRTVLGFNQQHDGRMVRAELRRAGMDDLFEQTPATCVMRSLQAAKFKIPKLNGKGGYPRLVDAAAHFGIAYDVSIRHQAAR